MYVRVEVDKIPKSLKTGDTFRFCWLVLLRGLIFQGQTAKLVTMS